MISVTKTALQKIIYSLQKRGKGLGIRIGVKTTGCSGLAYVLEFVDTPTDTDEVIDCSGCNIYIDKKSCQY